MLLTRRGLDSLRAHRHYRGRLRRAWDGDCLRQAGIDDFEILERSDDLGGTWRDNSYPGCAVDVESHLYSYSFAPNPDWSHVYSPQEEIWAYIRRCADEYDVTSRIRFGHEVTGADWDEARQLWSIETTAGEVEARS